MNQDNNIPSPFRLKGEELEKKVLETFGIFKRSSLVKDLNLTLEYDKFLKRFREYYFMIYPGDLDRVKLQIAKEITEYEQQILAIENERKNRIPIQRTVLGTSMRTEVLIKRRESINWDLLKRIHNDTGNVNETNLYG